MRVALWAAPYCVPTAIRRDGRALPQPLTGIRRPPVEISCRSLPLRYPPALPALEWLAGKLTDTGYKRDVFTVCTDMSKQKMWADLVPFMQSKTMRFEVVDEDGWKAKLKKLLDEAAND